MRHLEKRCDPRVAARKFVRGDDQPVALLRVFADLLEEGFFGRGWWGGICGGCERGRGGGGGVGRCSEGVWGVVVRVGDVGKGQNLAVEILRHRKQRIHDVDILFGEEYDWSAPKLILHKLMKIPPSVVMRDFRVDLLVRKLENIPPEIPRRKDHRGQGPVENQFWR